MPVLQVFECDRCEERTEPTRAGFAEMGFVSIDRPNINSIHKVLKGDSLLCESCAKAFTVWWEMIKG